MSDNRRQAFRCAVADVDARALLRISEGEVVVQVVDESAGGYGVESDRELAVREGELAGLTTESGQSICRVVRVEYHDDGKTAVGLQRISEIAEEPKSASNTGLFARWFGRSFGSLVLLLAFGLGTGCAVGFAQYGRLPFLNSSKSTTTAANGGPSIPTDPAKRAAALTQSFNSLDELKSRHFVKALSLTDGQQRKIDSVVDKLMLELATVHVDRGDLSPEAGSHMGLLMIRRAWLKVESTLTPEQMAKWDAMLDGEPAGTAGAVQAGL